MYTFGTIWDFLAHKVYNNYGGRVDWDEGCFYCPNCGEPIYFEDWDETDLLNGNDEGMCPICEAIIE